MQGVLMLTFNFLTKKETLNKHVSIFIFRIFIYILKNIYVSFIWHVKEGIMTLLLWNTFDLSDHQ